MSITNGSVNNLFLVESLLAKMRENEGHRVLMIILQSKQIDEKSYLSTNGLGPRRELDENYRSDQSGIGKDQPSYADVAALTASMSNKTNTKCSSATVVLSITPFYFTISYNVLSPSMVNYTKTLT